VNTLSRATFGAALAGLLLASAACSSSSSQAPEGTPLPAHQVLRMDGLDVTFDDVSPVRVNTDGTQRYVATYTVSNPDANTETWTFRKDQQVLFADGKPYPADSEATIALSGSGLEDVVNGGATEQAKVAFDVPAQAKVTAAGVYVGNALWRINLAS
jgi:hypothetical protein